MAENGQRCDLASVYETYYPLVYNYVFYRLLNKHDTEDMVSVIFMKVMNNLSAYDPTRASLKTWIYRIADNALIDMYRKRKNALSMDEENLGLENTLSVAFDDQYDEIANPTRKAIFKALSTLKERDRTFIYQKYFEHRTNRDIARELNMNESTVAAVLARARARLKTELSKEL